MMSETTMKPQQRMKIILNPYSRRWTARERIPEVRAALDNLEIDYDLVETEAPGHGIALAEEAARQGYSVIVAAGGDSTVNEVLNGMLRAERAEQAEDGQQVQDSLREAAASGETEALSGESAPPSPEEAAIPLLGILPLGTANDLAWALGISKDLRQAALNLVSNWTRPLDVGECNGRYFGNNVGIGLEPYVTHLQAGMQGTGTSRYLRAALKAIAHNPSWEMEIRWDTGRYHGPASLVSIGNGARTGGFFLTPEANPSDGYLDFIFGHLPSRWQAVRHLQKAMQSRNRLAESPLACAGRFREMHVTCTEPVYLHTDGELHPMQSEIHIRLHPKRVRVLAPAGGLRG